MTDPFAPAESAADEIRLRIESLDRKIANALTEADGDEHRARLMRADAERMTRIRDQYRALVERGVGA